MSALHQRRGGEPRERKARLQTRPDHARSPRTSIRHVPGVGEQLVSCKTRFQPSSAFTRVLCCRVDEIARTSLLTQARPSAGSLPAAPIFPHLFPSTPSWLSAKYVSGTLLAALNAEFFACRINACPRARRVSRRKSSTPSLARVR